jgi:hypothetical protein
MKSEKLKKLENELKDLTQWLNLGLVPKKELEKHKKEIKAIEDKILYEKERLRNLKETGEEEYVAPKRTIGKQVYAEPQTLPEMEVGGENLPEPEEPSEEEAATKKNYKEEATVIEEIEEDPYSDKNRWKRGILEDPDVDTW